MPYEKEIARVLTARDRLLRRAANLYGEDLENNFTYEERGLRYDALLGDFDEVARKLLHKADRDIAREQAALQKATQRQKQGAFEGARSRLAAAQAFKQAVLKTRQGLEREGSAPLLTTGGDR